MNSDENKSIQVNQNLYRINLCIMFVNLDLLILLYNQVKCRHSSLKTF